jgi:hypothetical protein
MELGSWQMRGNPFGNLLYWASAPNDGRVFQRTGTSQKCNACSGNAEYYLQIAREWGRFFRIWLPVGAEAH